MFRIFYNFTIWKINILQYQELWIILSVQIISKKWKKSAKIKLSNNSSFFILIFAISEFRNTGRSTFRRSKFWPPLVWSIPYRYGTLVIWIKRQYWPDSRSTNDEQHRAQYPKNFFGTRLCYYFFPKSITSKEYHLQILVENVKNWQSYDFFSEKPLAQRFLNDFFFTRCHVISYKSTFCTQSRMFKACSVIFLFISDG